MYQTNLRQLLLLDAAVGRPLRQPAHSHLERHTRAKRQRAAAAERVVGWGAGGRENDGILASRRHLQKLMHNTGCGDDVLPPSLQLLKLALPSPHTAGRAARPAPAPPLPPRRHPSAQAPPLPLPPPQRCRGRGGGQGGGGRTVQRSQSQPQIAVLPCLSMHMACASGISTLHLDRKTLLPVLVPKHHY